MIMDGITKSQAASIITTSSLKALEDLIGHDCEAKVEIHHDGMLYYFPLLMVKFKLKGIEFTISRVIPTDLGIKFPVSDFLYDILLTYIKVYLGEHDLDGLKSTRGEK